MRKKNFRCKLPFITKYRYMTIEKYSRHQVSGVNLSILMKIWYMLFTYQGVSDTIAVA